MLVWQKNNCCRKLRTWWKKLVFEKRVKLLSDEKNSCQLLRLWLELTQMGPPWAWERALCFLRWFSRILGLPSPRRSPPVVIQTALPQTVMRQISAMTRCHIVKSLLFIHLLFHGPTISILLFFLVYGSTVSNLLFYAVPASPGPTCKLWWFHLCQFGTRVTIKWPWLHRNALCVGIRVAKQEGRGQK
jgi:hypothetical protein